jgi:subtilisin family serine protease
MVQADQVSDANAGNTTICIIDSGYYASHEDLAGNHVSGINNTGTGNWYEDSCGHGTHVAGTISALTNSTGVVGVLPNGKVNLRSQKVFDGADCKWTYASTLVSALNNCRAALPAGQRLVVSMSLGGNVSSVTENNAFQSAYNAGVLSVAAAGNAGTTQKSYPASYSSVISVAAVDSNKVLASFSQRNSSVELAAPGVGVLSTVPFAASSVTAAGITANGENMEGSARTNASGTLVDGGLCSTAGSWAGKVVLCQRGTDTFATKVASVKNGGGVGAVIYNNVSGGFSGTLNGTSTIPAISISQEDGNALLAGAQNAGAVVANAGGIGSGYAYYDGTSMATPHVSGVAALVWSNVPTKTNAEIRAALQATAEDLGTAGKDNSYGYGLVRAKAALDYLGGGSPPANQAPVASFNRSCTNLACSFTSTSTGRGRHGRGLGLGLRRRRHRERRKPEPHLCGRGHQDRDAGRDGQQWRGVQHGEPDVQRDRGPAARQHHAPGLGIQEQGREQREPELDRHERLERCLPQWREDHFGDLCHERYGQHRHQGRGNFHVQGVQRDNDDLFVGRAGRVLAFGGNLRKRPASAGRFISRGGSRAPRRRTSRPP